MLFFLQFCVLFVISIMRKVKILEKAKDNQPSRFENCFPSNIWDNLNRISMALKDIEFIMIMIFSLEMNAIEIEMGKSNIKIPVEQHLHLEHLKDHQICTHQTWNILP